MGKPWLISELNSESKEALGHVYCLFGGGYGQIHVGEGQVWINCFSFVAHRGNPVRKRVCKTAAEADAAISEHADALESNSDWVCTEEEFYGED